MRAYCEHGRPWFRPCLTCTGSPYDPLTLQFETLDAVAGRLTDVARRKLADALEADYRAHGGVIEADRCR